MVGFMSSKSFFGGKDFDSIVRGPAILASLYHGWLIFWFAMLNSMYIICLALHELQFDSQMDPNLALRGISIAT
jgi:hypothetical protein